MKDGESILRIVRHFGLTYLPKGLLAFVLVAAPFFFLIPLVSLHTWGLLAFAISVFVGLIFGARLFMEWYWNAFVITTRRVIDIDQKGFFHRTVSEAPYEKVQDVSFSISGMAGTVLRYGTIVLQTAGAQINLELTRVRNPKEVHHLITETASALQSESNGGVRSQKVAHLLDTAADLTDSEARAFLVALQEAVAHGGEEHRLSVRPLEMIMEEGPGEDFLSGDVEGEDEE
ncbi:MAG: PH domain-containing protein [Patescibacteria group bacterium]|nr:PH domain-containing protein [Patescibacteria group bacterium]